MTNTTAKFVSTTLRITPEILRRVGILATREDIDVMGLLASDAHGRTLIDLIERIRRDEVGAQAELALWCDTYCTARFLSDDTGTDELLFDLLGEMARDEAC
jgi:hypothetical protein